VDFALDGFTYRQELAPELHSYLVFARVLRFNDADLLKRVKLSIWLVCSENRRLIT
jgi:hypothetical protein